MVPLKFAAALRHTNPYDDAFYRGQVEGSLRSARIILEILWRHIQPQSVLDVGCGRGAWLSACRELGSQTIHGIDGEWNRGEAMIEAGIVFSSQNLERPLQFVSRYDLVICLEVAEHLNAHLAPLFVKTLTTASDLVLFSAAYSNQGGTHHINEQPHTYWAKIFSELGYAPFDLFRSETWGNDHVEFWYRQNAFLYAKLNSQPYRQLQEKRLSPMADIAFMDCIHPKLFEQIVWEFRRANARAKHATEFKAHLRDLMPSLWRSVKARLRQV